MRGNDGPAGRRQHADADVDPLPLWQAVTRQPVIGAGGWEGFRWEEKPLLFSGKSFRVCLSAEAAAGARNYGGRGQPGR